MKILLITDLYPIANDGEPKTISYFVNHWKQSGHDVDVIRPNFLLNAFIRGKKIISDGEYQENGVRILNCNYITPFLFDITQKLPECFDVGHYDVVVSHMPSGTLFADKLLRGSSVPFIASVHASDIEVLTNPIYKFYFGNKLKKAYLNADKISPRSYVLADRISTLIPQISSKTFVAFSGIEEEYIEPEDFFIDKVKDLNKTKSLRIVTVASLIRRKHVELILMALSKFEDFSFTVIGTGRELYSLRKYSYTLGLSDNVYFAFEHPRKVVLENLKKSNIFILMSEKETFGMAYLEAMAKGNILIGRKNDGIDGIINNNENGFLCENANQLVETLNKILNMEQDKLEKLQHNSFNTINSYTDEIAGKNYLENITKLVEEKNAKVQKLL